MKAFCYCCIYAFSVLVFSSSSSSEVTKTASADSQPERANVSDDVKPVQWMTYYYLKPQPDLTPKMILAMSRDGVFDRENALPPITAFLSRVFAQNPNDLHAWFVQFDDLPKEHKKTLWQALWYADTKEAKRQLQRIAEKSVPSDQDDLEKLLKSKPPALTEVEINSGGVLDMQWGAFFATGDERYVIRIMSALAWINENEDTIRKALGGVARWSLASNCFQHGKILRICKEQVSKQPQEVSQILSGIIEEAEARKGEVKSGM